MAHAIHCLDKGTDYITSGDLTNIKAVTDGFAVKIVFRGDMILGLASWDATEIFHCDAFKFKVEDATGALTTFHLLMETGGGASRVGLSSLPVATFSADTWYIFYADHFHAADDANAYLFGMDGEVLASNAQGYSNGVFSASDPCEAGFGNKLPGGLDTVAIYTQPLTGKARYSEPTAEDDGIQELWFFNENQGNYIRNEIPGQPYLVLGGIEDTEWSWIAGMWPTGKLTPRPYGTTRILRPSGPDGVKPEQWAVDPALVDPTYQDLHRGLILGVPFWYGHVEDGGTWEDVSPYRRTLTLDNSSSDLSLYTSTHGEALNLAGSTNDRVDIGSVPSTDPLSLYGATGLTIAFLAQIPAGADWYTTWPRIIDKSNSGNASNGWAVETGKSDSPDKMYFYHDIGGGEYLQDKFDSEIYQGGWHLYTYRLGAAGTGQWYVDGIEQSVSAGTYGNADLSQVLSTTTNAAIGNWNHDVNRMLTGRISALYVWDRVISESAIMALVEDPFGPIRPARRVPVAKPTPSTAQGGRWVRR